LANTKNPDFWFLMGLIDLYGGNSLKAKKCFAEGIRLDPEHEKCRLSLAKAKKCEQLKEEGNEFIKNQQYE
jgi:DnaJ family protein C protein 7